MKKRLLVTLLILGLVVLIAACGGNGDDGSYIPMFHRFWSVIGIEDEGTTEEVRAVFENFGVVVLDIEVDDHRFRVEFEFNPGDLDIADYLENLEYALYLDGYERW